ncbi:MAG: indolepyruvate ferredoxin oxidoreductase family protein [Xanthomonadales bacterium]
MPQHQANIPDSSFRLRTLDDIYTATHGSIFISGTQALARLPLLQRRLDIEQGLNTAGFISGYRGSPLAGYDMILKSAEAFLAQHQITFQPAINEEMAAAAIIGTQQVAAEPDRTCDGIFSLWYGKGPGLDRAADALKHANSIGTTPLGGVLVVVGDDHNAISSALAHQSEQLFASFMMPVLHPSGIPEIIEYGLLGWAMSRFSGCYVGLKIESESIESAVSLDLNNRMSPIVLPEFEFPPDGVHYRWPYRQLENEARLQNFKLPAALAFARANTIDRVMLRSDHPRIGIVTTGKAYLAVRQALDDLGIDEARAQHMGLSIYKVGMPWPLETIRAIRFAEGLEDVLVIEEKRSVIESQLKDALYNLPARRRPRVSGKTGPDGNPLFPGTGVLQAEQVAQILARHWPDLAPADHATEFLARIEAQQQIVVNAGATRTPFYCSGCPHNRSTTRPKNSRVLAGTGCHLMAVFMDRDTSGFLHMGAEGANWVGQAPFCKTGHIFQNLGDGTYTHSGSLAIRQAVAAGVNITYRILYNDVVAMTGGQPVEGSLSVAQITRQLHAEGVRRIALVSDDPGKYPSNLDLAPGVTIHHRDSLAFVEQELSGVSGVTALIYDQICAAEKRRRKRRSKPHTPETRVFINEAVCEGCGDCLVQSNCVSVVPKQTAFGIKRQIDQASCNVDLSCLEGFCPSFITICGGSPSIISTAEAGRLEAAIAGLPQPELPSIEDSFDIVITGIGGQGVVTVGRIAGMAADLQGLSCSVLDFPGLAQKGGGVMSYVRLTRRPGKVQAARVPLGKAALLLAGDMVTALDTETIGRIRKHATRAIVNTHVSPTGANVLDPHSMLDAAQLKNSIIEAVGSTAGNAGPGFINATRICARLTGMSITANIFLLGYAYQAGTLPISIEAITQAITLNGAGSETNLLGFAYGRLAAHDPALVEEIAGLEQTADAPGEKTLDQLILEREQYLGNYQNSAYGKRYRNLVDMARTAEQQTDGAGEAFTRAVVEGLFQIMAYKDEYEIARLLTDESFMQQVRAQFSGKFKIKHHLAPPLFARRDRTTGKIRKITFGIWIRPVLRLLARFKFLRGTPLDVFGYTRERRLERARIVEYERTISEICSSLSPANLSTATEIAALASTIRGYGHVKEQNVIKATRKLAQLRGSATG